MNVNNSALNN